MRPGLLPVFGECGLRRLRFGEVPGYGPVRKQKCSLAKSLAHCYECPEPCRNGILSKIKPYAFTEFARRYGEEHLLDCLARNEQNGVVYHREGLNGDYDDFTDVEELIEYIRTGKR